jgi:hypothetical protein
MTKEESDAVLRLACKAVEIDTGFASAYAIAAWCYVRRQENQWSADRVQERADALRMARLATELGKQDALALAWAAYAFAFVGRDADHAAAPADRAIELNPNLAFAWGISGWVRNSLGEPDAAQQSPRRDWTPTGPSTWRNSKRVCGKRNCPNSFNRRYRHPGRRRAKLASRCRTMCQRE